MLFSKPSVSFLHLPILAHAVLHVLCSVLLTCALSRTKIALHVCVVCPVHIWERLKSVESQVWRQHCLNFAIDVVTLFFNAAHLVQNYSKSVRVSVFTTITLD